ncbi:MAG: hypothetical protein KA141_13730 [Rubrivivax sp.]|jgi:hypothetical protein|nr:hypothetical protein [Rubrivivax sp.]
MKQAETRRLLLRAFVQAPGEADVHATSTRLLQALHAFAPRPAGPPERYWKLPQWVELTLDLAPATAASFDRLLAMQPQGWADSGDEHDRSAVWNAAPGVAWLLPELQWAELILTVRPGTDQVSAQDATPETVVGPSPDTPLGTGGG